MSRILVVDDEEGLRMTLAANLELEGFEVMEAGSASEALGLLERERFDLVLTDIRMPGMNGVELFRTLRAKETELPVVLMTAFALEELVQSALEEGAFAVLSKPFDVAQALRLLSRASRSPTVLVVDDTESVGVSLSAALNGCGVRAQAVQDGEEALKVLKEGEVDVCVVDMVMPGRSGAELAEELRNISPGVIVIAMSGHDVPELVRRVANTGMHSFLRKPFPVTDLIRNVALARGKQVGT